MHIRGVSFDLWFTLLIENRGDIERYTRARVESIRRALLEVAGEAVSLDDVEKAFERTSEVNARIFLNPRDLIKVVLADLGIEPEPRVVEEVLKAYLGSVNDFTPKVNPEAFEALSMLRRAGLRIAVVSNSSFTGDQIKSMLVKVGLGDYVDVVVSSCDVGVSKPSPAIFQEAARRLGLDPGSLIHVGDSYLEDVLGALAAGYAAAVHYMGLAQSRHYKVDSVPPLYRSRRVYRAQSLVEAAEIILRLAKRGTP